MKSFTLSHKMSHTVGLAVATLALSAGLFVMVERADATCTPATSPGTVINGQTVDCTGTTAGQNDPNGWGTGAESGVTVNVQQGASVSGTAGGIDINAGTVNNHGGGSFIEATGIDGTAIRAEGGVLTVANSAGGVIQSNNTGGAGIVGVGDVVLTNSGLIQATDSTGVALAASAFATVTNSIGGIITGGAKGISAGTINVMGNGGTIEALSANGDALSAANVTVNNKATGIIRANNANGSAIFGDTINIIDNSGVIEAKGMSGVAIDADIKATVANGGGVISGALRGIQANIANVTNAGEITATADSGIAISAASTANVDNSGIIQAMGTGGVAIVGLASTTTVHNLSGGTIKGGQFGIVTNPGATLDVTNGAGATISGGLIGIEGSGTVRNAGTITGADRSVHFTGSGTNTLILQTGSVLNGTAGGESTATNKLILQGGGVANNDFLGFNTLDVQGSGGSNEWVLNGTSSVGTATISSGGLVVGDAAHAGANLIGDVTVGRGNLLEGHGTITGNVTVTDAGVRPGGGNSIGTLHVTGDVTFNGSPQFNVNVNAAGDTSKLAVGGTAKLAGEVIVAPSGNPFAPSTRYTILTAARGLGGTTFNEVTTILAFLTPSLSYDSNNVFLTLACNDPAACGSDTGGGDAGGGTTGGGTASTGFGFAKVAQTRNQRAVATALDRGPVSNPLIIAVLNQTVAGALQAFDALSGEVFGSVHNTQGQEAQFARSAMLGRMRQSSYAGIPGDLGALGFGGPQLAYASDNASAAYATKAAPGARGPSRDLTFWAQGLGGWGHADSDGNAASLRSRFGGFLSGVDARFGDTLRAGFVAGYMRSDLNVNARSSSAGIDSVQLGAYATGQLGAFNIRGGGSYSLDSIDTSRAIIFPGFADKASARFHGNVGQVFGEIGYGMAFGSVAVEPLAGLAYVHVRDGSFLESGGVAALSGASANENTGYSFLGVRVASAMPLANGTVLIPRGMLQWQHAFGDVTPVSALAFQGTGAGFSVAGIPIARDTALVEAGFDWRFATQAKLGAFYQGELAAHAQTHAVKGAFTWDF
jgi:outer membrane autotransporter protein